MNINKITISGQICTGKTTLLKDLQKELNWQVFITGKLFREYVTKNNLNLEQVEEQSEVMTKKIDYQVRDMINAPGNLIVDGWMSGIMANNLPNVLKILLICDDNVRYQRFAKREKISIEEAKKRVDERQNNWFKKIEKIHNINRKEFVNKDNYNLVIDTTNKTPQDILNTVISRISS